jgi:alkylation response protein AidB-like acyl-CoA dehydrogenase
MGIALTEDQAALADSVRQFAKRHAATEQTRHEFEDLAAGMWPTAWSALTAQGYLGLHLPEEVGGDGAGLVELAVLLEEAARALLPGPLLTTVLTSLAVSRFGPPSLAETVLPRFVGGATAGAATTSAGLAASRVEGGWEISGTSAPLLGATSGQFLLLGAEAPDGVVWFLAPTDRADALKIEKADGVDPTRDIGRVTLAGFAVADDEVLDVDDDRLRGLAAVLFAAEAAGVARWCQETGLAYIKVREQFGRTVGSFQAVKHKAARLFAQVELMTAAAWDAAAAVDLDAGQDGAQTAYTAAAAALTCLNGAVEIGLDSITLFGGIGYTWEHDVHLYWRRAMSLANQLGPAHAWQSRLGELANTVTRARRFDLGDEPEGLRARVAEQLAGAKSAPDGERRAVLARAGLLTPHYPDPYGSEADAVAQVIIAQEFERAGLTQSGTGIGDWALPTILAHGTDSQRERFAWPTLLGEITWCQLFSEPGAGSDLASLRTRAERTDGGWSLSGQKVWTSMAAQADWGICLARTDPSAPKHRGISYFIVDMHSPGLEVRPLREANGGYLFNEVFFDNVFVPDDLLVGEPGQGWRLARTTLGNERVSIGSGASGPKEDPAALARSLGVAGPAVTLDVGALTARVNAFEALVQRGVLRRLGGMHPGAESSILKVVSAQMSADIRRTAMSWVGPAAAVLGGAGGGTAEALLSTPTTLIGGGTAEIQLNVISEQVLGLPRG